MDQPSPIFVYVQQLSAIPECVLISGQKRKKLLSDLEIVKFLVEYIKDLKKETEHYARNYIKLEQLFAEKTGEVFEEEP